MRISSKDSNYRVHLSSINRSGDIALLAQAIPPSNILNFYNKCQF